MGLIRSLTGTMHIEITSADPAGILSSLSAEGIVLQDVVFAGDITVCAAVYRKDYDAVKRLLEKRGEKLTVIKRQGLYWTGKQLLHRPLIVLGITALLALALFLPSRIFFVRVEGNTATPTKLILEQAQQCGIYFGASRQDVRSEKVKNALLESIPQLQWAGVNTSGCVATISVREKSEGQDAEQETVGVSSIVAARDGIILECTVTSGNALCQVGQAVKAGQTLVSGYTDCGIMIKATKASAEIYAQTLHEADTLTLSDAALRGDVVAQEKRYGLLLGKKLINFNKDSGISDSTCVKMYSERYITLPGGFQLPVALVIETVVYYDTAITAQTEADSYDWLNDYTEEYLQTQMIAGQIINGDTSLWFDDGICCLTGQYLCTEMIGRTKYEQIIQGDA